MPELEASVLINARSRINAGL